ncbi:DUF839 domain-containing protein [soil metagenome]
MVDVDRRTFVKQGLAATAGGIVLAGPMQALVARGALGAGSLEVARNNGGYGPLVPQTDLRDGMVRLHLPHGFRYRSFTPTGSAMADGVPTPGFHDGMAAFPAGRGRIRLVRNHEVNGPGEAFGVDDRAYDPMTMGGTTTVEVDRHAESVKSWVSMNGTQLNCAGGGMPWGSWVTAEETINGPDVTPDFTGVSNESLKQPHGFIFEVRSSWDAGEHHKGVPILHAGRFPHEAVDVDPASGILYETEDNFGFPSGLYRYKAPRNPMKTRRLLDGGVLEMLAIDGEPRADLTTGRHPGDTLAVRWVKINRPYPGHPDGDGTFDSLTDQDAALTFVGDQGRARGGAIFSRLEGIFYADRKIYVISTQGGDTPEGVEGPSGFGDGFGQVWVYDIARETLTLLFESPSPDVLDMPDNMTVSPSGSLLLCEDGEPFNYLRGLNRRGQIFDFALNAIRGGVDAEFAGATFSPNGRTLFVNIQSENGLTLAIWGPWDKGAL